MQNIGNSFSKDEIDSRDMKEQALLNICNDANKFVEFSWDMCDSITTPKCIQAILKIIDFH